MIVILMGPSGAGKSTVGRLLSETLGWTFVDGDDFHAAVNIDRMRAGIPLRDEDRAAWLDALAEIIEAAVRDKRSAVLACSALRRQYRERLVSGIPSGSAAFIYLRATWDLLEMRLAGRTDHFFPVSLLDSQMAALEAPGDAEPAPVFTLDASAAPPKLVAEIRVHLGL